MLIILGMLLTSFGSLGGFQTRHSLPYQSAPLPVLHNGYDSNQPDWLVDNSSFTASIEKSKDDKRLILNNGLVAREFVVEPNVATIGLKNRVGQQLLRAVRPEAQITIDGRTLAVGGLLGQPNHAFLTNDWIEGLTVDANSMQCVGFEIGKPVARFGWKQVRHHAPNSHWPPPGVSIRFDYRLPEPGPDRVADNDLVRNVVSDPNRSLLVSIHYEIYDGIPTLCKWLTIENQGSEEVSVDSFKSEILALVEKDSHVETRDGVALPRPDMLRVETDFAFGGFAFENANRHVVRYQPDPQYSTQVNYLRKTPCLLVVSPTYGPAQSIQPGATFQSYRTFEVAFDSRERERRSLTVRRNYRIIAPWITENPIMHHLLSSDPQRVRKAIDEAVSVGFEMIILSFGSGFDMENDSEEYLSTWKAVAEYAESKGIEIGSYSLLSSRRIGNGNDIVPPQGSRPTHGSCPALASDWGVDYYRKLYSFFEKTGFDLLEHDGPYPGDVDVTSRPPLQKGVNDSRWVQWRIATRFYEHCRGQGIYLNTPDFYYLNGSSKCGMGYREVNWSLPRGEQIIHTRQNIFDGTWSKTPSMGWMFVPLSQYHGGGAAATIEPLKDHLEHYSKMLQCNLAFGVQACYRGPRLFDSHETQQVVKDQVDWFKKYREVLEADLIHGKRADGRDLDWMLHVNPTGKHKGMLVVFNPGDTTLAKTLRVPLYYTGLTTAAKLTFNGLSEKKFTLNRDFSIDVDIEVKPNDWIWVLVESP